MPVEIQILSSSKNPLIKDVRRAADRGVLTEEGLAVCEGAHLYDEAVSSGVEIGGVLVSEEAAGDRDWAEGTPVFMLPRTLFREVATTDSPQGIITLVRPRAFALEQILRGTAVLLDGIQDPGNAGAIVRAAEAFGASGVVFLKSTVSAFNPKCLRAAAGSLFRLPFVTRPDNELVRAGIERLFAAMPGASVAIDEVDWGAGPAAIVIGSEGRGVSSEWAAEAKGVRIPTIGVESLNAAVAAAVILYEARKKP